MKKLIILACLISTTAMAAESAGTASGTGASTNSGINKQKSSEPREVPEKYGKGGKKKNSQGNVPYAGSQGQQEDGNTPSNPPRQK